MNDEDQDFNDEQDLENIPNACIKTAKKQQTIEPNEKKLKMENADNKVINVLLDNFERAYGADTPEITFFKKLLVDITKNNAAKHFVGIQPMTGPYGGIYALQGKSDDDGEILQQEVISNVIESRSSKLNTILTGEVMDDVASGHYSEELNNRLEKLQEVLKRDISSEIYETIRQDITKVSNTVTTKVDNVGELMILIGQCSNEIGKKTRRGCGSFVIASKSIVNMLEKELVIDETLLHRDYGYLEYVGTINGLPVYHDHTIRGNTAIVGYKGSTDIDAGYMYCPYLPLNASGLMIEALDFNPCIKFSSRYGVYVNQKTTEVVSDDGRETVITREPCNYYVTLNLTLPSIKFDDNTTVETVKNSKEVSKTVENSIGGFDSAMDLLN